MKKSAKIMALGLLLVCGPYGCKQKDDIKPPAPPKYSITFNLNASGAPFRFNTIVPNSANTRYSIEELLFYMGYPRLVKTDNTEVPLAPLLLMRFDSAFTQNPIYGNNFSYTVPAGDYKSIKFGIGVPPQIRDTITHYHYDNNDPLNRGFGMIWDMTLNNYRNIAITGYIDTTKAQSKKPDVYFTYHILETGTLPIIYKEVEIADPFTVSAGGTHQATLSLDVNNIFFNKTNAIDIRHNRVTDMSTGPQFTLGVMIKDNLCASIARQ
jgi:hypothetical protein